MSRTTWIVDAERFAGKILTASQSGDPNAVSWRSNPTRTCQKCNHIIDNSDVSQEWPGLPKGVKFDPTDQELLCHLLAKVRVGGAAPHPFIDAFISTIEGVDGICYTHPKKLPGVKQDGSVSHFFHQTFKAYNTGTRKRRKISHDAIGDVRWHKTGKTKPVIVDGVQQGCKKIMVLYMSTAKGGKPEKTNWVMHQYHLGTEEDEKDGEFVVSKVFYQQQTKQNDKCEADASTEIDIPDENNRDKSGINPKLATPEPSTEKRISNLDLEQASNQATGMCEPETKDDSTIDKGENLDNHDNISQDPKWCEGDSQFLLDSQQLAECIAICDEFLQSQSSCGSGSKGRASFLSDYDPVSLKDDLQKWQNPAVRDHPPDVTRDTPDLRLSQLTKLSIRFSSWLHAGLFLASWQYHKRLNNTAMCRWMSDVIWSLASSWNLNRKIAFRPGAAKKLQTNLRTCGPCIVKNGTIALVYGSKHKKSCFFRSR